MAGGERSDSKATDSFWEYNSVLDEWKELQNMQTHRSELGTQDLQENQLKIGHRTNYNTTTEHNKNFFKRTLTQF